MKKSILKLVLHRETVRTLANTELAQVVGGQVSCPAVTREESSCVVAQAQAAPRVLDPTTRQA